MNGLEEKNGKLITDQAIGSEEELYKNKFR